MKNLKEIKKEVTPKDILRSISTSYAYIMGGTRKLIVDGEELAFVDEREYYSGRGGKYNKSIRHDEQVYNLTPSQYDVEVKKIAKKRFEAEKRINFYEKQKKQAKKRYADNHKNGVYGISYKAYCTSIELSDEEITGKYFSTEKLSKTLNISVADAELLKSKGKTYVFAEKLGTNEMIELYHADLTCNSLNICVSIPTAERIAEFNSKRNDYTTAPYSQLVGQTEANNHFVC